ncbi:hypothetical protein RsTz2092_00390 [Deferribacterales bacterium RsTz2092]|nr:hypothetical protein AGMMS49941_01310 [Deferribacterales bacterium]
MNIFKVLASYSGRVDERNVSAVLAYLLDPTGDHGLGSCFLKKITGLLEREQFMKKYSKNPREYKVEVYGEEPLDTSLTASNKNERRLDVCVWFRDKNGNLEFILGIENKVRIDSMIDKRQIEDEFEGLREKARQDNCQMSLILICPDKSKMVCEIEGRLKEHFNVILWKCIAKKLKDILREESTGEIDPISTELQYLLKSFIVFIENGFESEPQKEKIERQNYGKPVREYIREVADKLEKNKTYELNYVAERVREAIRKAVNKEINEYTLLLQLRCSTVNSKGRRASPINNESKAVDEKFSLFYHPTDKDEEHLIRFDKISCPKNITLWWYGNKTGTSLSEVLSE